MLDAIFNRAADGIFLADDQGRYVRVNPAAEKLTGYSNAELCAMTVFDLTPAPNKDEALAMWREFIQQGNLSGGYSLARKDGSLAEVEFQAVANIKPGVHLSIVHDVTARNRDERRLRRAARLQEATASMSASVEIAQVAEVILSVALATLGAQAGNVAAVVEGGAFAEVVATAGMSPEREEEWAENYRSIGAPPKTVDGRYRFSLDAPSALAVAFERGGPIRVEQVVDLAPLPAKGKFADLGGAMACLPLVVSGALVGGLYLFWKEKRSFDEDEASFAETLAGLCAQSLDRARLFTAEREARERAVASEKRIFEYKERLRSMAFDRVVVEERERHRVATALHDGVTQYLALAKMNLTPLRQRLEGADRSAMDAALKLIAEAIAETRSLSFELSPPVLYDLGLKAALSWLSEKLEQSTGLRTEIADDGIEWSLDDVTASIVFRAVRELLTNVFKHAKAATAKVSVRHLPGQLEVAVEDPGIGFNPAETAPQSGFGLMSVREQISRLGGTVEITSIPGDGTRIVVRVPSRQPSPSREEGSNASQ